MRDDDDISPAPEDANARTLASASSKNAGIKVGCFTAFEDCAYDIFLDETSGKYH